MRLEDNNKMNSVKPSFTILRFAFLFSTILSCFLWPYSGLTPWHLAFYIILMIGLYASFTYFAINLMFYLVIMLLYWVIAPIFQVRTGVRYIDWTNDIPTFGPMALTYVTIHLLGVVLGYAFMPTPKLGTQSYSFRFSIVGVSLGIILTICILFIIGFHTVLQPRISQGAAEASSYLLFLENVVKLLPSFILVYVILSKHEGNSNNYYAPILVFLFLMQVVISNPINTGRFISLYGVLLVVTSYLLLNSKIRFLSLAVICFPFYALFFLAITSMMRSGLENLDLARILFYLQTLEFSSYSIFIDALSIDNDKSQGNYLISHLLVFIPRSIWTGKADMIGAAYAEPAGYVATNVGLHSFFNAYADYGFLGLLTFSILFGCIIRNLNPLREPAFFKNRRFVYGVIVFSLMPMIFRGGLNTVMIAFYASIVSYEVIRYFTRFRVYR